MSPQLYGAVALLGESMAMGLYLSLGFRIRTLESKEKASEILNSKAFKIASATQLNNAEWAPLFITSLLYLHSQDAGSYGCALMSVVSCTSFVVVRLAGIVHLSPIASTIRYAVLGWLIYEVASTGFNK